MTFSQRLTVYLVTLLAPASATTITILPAANLAEAIAERNTWLVQTFGPGTTPTPIDPVLKSREGPREVTKVKLLTSFYSLYFFLTDVEDNVTIRTSDGTKARVHGDDDGLYFVGINSSTAIESVRLRSRDDFGLRDFGTAGHTADTPEPASWATVLPGLLVITLVLSIGRALAPTKSRGRGRPHPPGRLPPGRHSAVDQFTRHVTRT